MNKQKNQTGGISFSGRNYYKLIGVNKNASIKEISKAYRKKALKLHPDKHPTQIKKYTELFKEMEHAYAILKKYRIRYDYYILSNEPKPKRKSPPKPKPKPKRKSQPKTKPQSKKKSPPKPKQQPKRKSSRKTKTPIRPLRREEQQRLQNIILKDDVKSLKKEFDNGIDINSGITAMGETPLLFSIKNRSRNCAIYLLKNKANIHAKDGRGNNTLMIASGGGHWKIVKILFKLGAKVNSKNIKGENALYKTVVNYNQLKRNNKEDRIKYIKTMNILLDNDSQVNIKTRFGKEEHLLDHVIKTESFKIFKMFFDEGITIKKRVILEDMIELLRRTHEYDDGAEYMKMLKLIVTKIKPKNLLHKAANLEIAKLLIKHGDKPTKFYDNKKFLSKEVEDFVYPSSPSQKPKKKSKPKKKEGESLYEKIFGEKFKFHKGEI